MFNLAPLGKTSEGVSWAECRAGRRLSSSVAIAGSAKGALLACFSPASGVDEGAEPLTDLHSSAQKAAQGCHLTLWPCSYRVSNLGVLDAGVDLSEAG